jgi:hypothetical protein
MTSPDQSTIRNEILSSLLAEDFGLLVLQPRLFEQTKDIKELRSEAGPR